MPKAFGPKGSLRTFARENSYGAQLELRSVIYRHTFFLEKINVNLFTEGGVCLNSIILFFAAAESKLIKNDRCWIKNV